MQRAVLIAALAALLASASAAGLTGQRPTVPSYDGVLPLSGIERFDGAVDAPAASAARLRQAVHELHLASVARLPWPSARRLRDDARSLAGGVIPISLLNARYRRDGAVGRAFAAAALHEYTYRGGRVVFALSSRHYLSNDERAVAGLELDFDDGRGFRPLEFDTPAVVGYPTTGAKTIRVRLTLEDGDVLHGAFGFDVRSLATPVPDDTLSITASIPHDSQFGTGEAFVYLANGHTSITNPIVAVEGFDIENTMNWDELYALLNDENLIETLRADGYDAVVLNFTDATVPMQENAFVLVELLEQVRSMIAPQGRFPLIGASMGGLVGRYALAYMETNAIAHGVATFIAFDVPHRGANIPLGIQYWLSFFSSASDDAAFLLSRLDRPAALQMLVYHYTEPASSSPAADPLRASFESDLAAVGGYPSLTRNVAVANGSGTMQSQGFAAGAQILEYNFSIPLLATVKGNVWAVPDGGSTRIFEGVYNVFLVENRQQDVTVTGTLPYDNAPGGSRASMAQMDSTEAPFGDIVAVYDRHCFIPTVSALDLDTGDLFYDVAGDTALLSMSPFDELYFPQENQPHVDITPENAAWFLSEIRGTPSAASAAPRAVPWLAQNSPNPFNPVTTIRFVVATAGRVELAVYDVRGKLVSTLVDRVMPTGPHAVRWDGRGRYGETLSSGVYFYRLTTPVATITRKMVLIK